jgi:predicted negative regulator of RcsB-dependent stress response
MKTKLWLIVIAAVVLLGLVGWTGFEQRSQRAAQAAWEYKVIYVPGARNLSEEAMNKMGAQGWELITFQAINNEGGTIGAGNYFFKRARTNQP